MTDKQCADPQCRKTAQVGVGNPPTWVCIEEHFIKYLQGIQEAISVAAQTLEPDEETPK